MSSEFNFEDACKLECIRLRSSAFGSQQRSFSARGFSRRAKVDLNQKYATKYRAIYDSLREEFQSYVFRWSDSEHEPLVSDLETLLALEGCLLGAHKKHLNTKKSRKKKHRHRDRKKPGIRVNRDPSFGFFFERISVEPELDFLAEVEVFLTQERRRMRLCRQTWDIPSISEFRQGDLQTPVLCSGTMVYGDVGKKPVRFEAVFNALNGVPFPHVREPGSENLKGVWDAMLQVLGIELAERLWDSGVWNTGEDSSAEREAA